MKKTNCFSAMRQIRSLYFIFLVYLGGFVFPEIKAQVTNSAKTFQNCKEIFAGPSTIFEDNGLNRFNTYGGNFTYTYPVSSRLGITGDAGVYFGSNSGWKYTKFQLLGGVSLLPPPGQNNKVLFSPHLLAGISNVTSKYSGINSISNNSTSLSIAAGTNILFPLNSRTSLALRADYNPTFSSGAVSNNFRVGAGLSFNIGCNQAATNPNEQNTNATQEKIKCKASKNTRELKMAFVAIERACKSAEEYANKIPRVDAKLQAKAQLTVKQGEECCLEDSPPVQYTELKGGVEGSADIKITLWGIPDINYSLKLWPVLLIAEFKCKVTVGPTFKFNVDGVGKFYGELLNPIDPGPDCKSCWYLNLKEEGFIKLGVEAGGSINIYHWSPFGEGEAGFNINEAPDEKVEAKAEASASIGVTFNGTYRSVKGCKKPPEGTHGTFTFGKAKANLKFNITLGPISFDPSFEVNLFDGWDVTF
ncbi:MAG TPA: hypothetical protein VET23_09780 [Chitinophagaceae bacterium]|nr:hypothetical protein [Chitinophagaceae bacterium]